VDGGRPHQESRQAHAGIELKGRPAGADIKDVEILVHCLACGGQKRPLRACDTCGAVPVRAERVAWRAAIRTRCLERMTLPERPQPLPRIPRIAPRELIVTVVEPARRTLELVSPLPLPEVQREEPLSFDWHERRRLRLLRRSA
jgi:ribosomal protein L32